MGGRARLRNEGGRVISVDIRRLGPHDAAAFQSLRIEGFRLEPYCFRFAPEDESALPLSKIETRLARDFVVGAFDDETLIGIAGLSRFTGAKVAHKALLWGMYVRAAHRGGDAADRLMRAILDHADRTVETVTLTVIATNARALRFYQRRGFQTYGVEPASVALADGGFLDEALMIRRRVG